LGNDGILFERIGVSENADGYFKVAVVEIIATEADRSVVECNAFLWNDLPLSGQAPE